MINRLDISKAMRDFGVSAVPALSIDIDYKLLTKDVFFEACKVALRNLRARGLGYHRGNQSWECNHLAFSVYAEIVQYHALNYSGDAAVAVGVFPYFDGPMNSGHAINMAIVGGVQPVFFDPTRGREKVLNDYEKGMAPTYLI